MMIPKETKQLFSVPKRHPWAVIILYVPVVLGVVVSSLMYRFTFAYCLPMLWCLLVSFYLIQGFENGELTDNHGTAIRRQTPVRFWSKVSIWSGAYIFAIAWCIGFAVQEQRKINSEPRAAADKTKSFGSGTNTNSPDASFHRGFSH